MQVGSKGGSDRWCLPFITCCCDKIHWATSERKDLFDSQFQVTINPGREVKEARA